MKEQRSIMKRSSIILLIAAGLFAAGSSIAQNGPGPRGKGYGGPPQSAEERAARQAACLERNGGVCPQGGPRAECPGWGKGRGQGQGKQLRWGARDGTGPRGGTTNCPVNPGPARK